MRYQIIVKPLYTDTPDDAPRWSFVAHGAVYDRDEAYSYRDTARSRGFVVRLLPVKS